VSISCCHAGGGQGTATACGGATLGCRSRLGLRQASTAPVRGKALAHFLLQGRCGCRLANRCAQGLCFLSDAPCGRLTRPQQAVPVLESRCSRGSEIDFKREGRSHSYKQTSHGLRTPRAAKSLRFVPAARAAQRASHTKQACFAMLTLALECVLAI
jgi:hypothetical protein